MRTLSTILLTSLITFFFVSTTHTQWVQKSLESSNVFCYDVSSTNIFAGTHNSVRKPQLSEMFTDTPWVKQNSGTAVKLRGVCFTDANTGTVVGDSGTILHTTDGGATWTKQNSQTTVNLHKVSFADAWAGIAVGDSGVILRTTDGGSLWTIQITDNRSKFWDVSMVTPNVGTIGGWGWGGGPILRTTDGGQNWNEQRRDRYGAIVAVSFSNTDSGSAAVSSENDGSILRTTNGGTDWVRDTLNSFYYISDMSFSDNMNGGLYHSYDSPRSCYGCGLMHTTDGGEHWYHQYITDAYPPQYRGFSAISFADAQNGAAVGYNGFIIQTTDGGEHWMFEPSGTNATLWDVSFTDANTGTAVGDSGIILRRTTAVAPKPPKNITATAGVHGRIEPSGIISVPHGGTQRFMFIPENESCVVDTVYVDGMVVDSTEGYTFERVYSPHSIYVVFTDTTTTLTHQLHSGWNLLSIPLHPNKHDVISNYPGATSCAYEYSGRYVECDSIIVAKGYWLKVDEANQFSLFGERTEQATVNVQKNWNIIGSLSKPISATSITSFPPGMITSSLWGYDGNEYHASDTIYPGKGYWVKVNQAGSLILSTIAETNIAERIKIVPTSEQPPPGPNDRTNITVENEIPKEFKLEQNYPNPFNPLTVIRYHLPAGQAGLPVGRFAESSGRDAVSTYNVSLKVYNLLGQEVATLVNEIQNAGYKSVKFDGSTLSSGVYFYKLVAGNYTAVKKLLITK